MTPPRPVQPSDLTVPLRTGPVLTGVLKFLLVFWWLIITGEIMRMQYFDERNLWCLVVRERLVCFILENTLVFGFCSVYKVYFFAFVFLVWSSILFLCYSHIFYFYMLKELYSFPLFLMTYLMYSTRVFFTHLPQLSEHDFFHCLQESNLHLYR